MSGNTTYKGIHLAPQLRQNVQLDTGTDDADFSTRIEVTASCVGEQCHLKPSYLAVGLSNGKLHVVAIPGTTQKTQSLTVLKSLNDVSDEDDEESGEDDSDVEDDEEELKLQNEGSEEESGNGAAESGEGSDEDEPPHRNRQDNLDEAYLSPTLLSGDRCSDHSQCNVTPPPPSPWFDNWLPCKLDLGAAPISSSSVNSVSNGTSTTEPSTLESEDIDSCVEKLEEIELVDETNEDSNDDCSLGLEILFPDELSSSSLFSGSDSESVYSADLIDDEDCDSDIEPDSDGVVFTSDHVDEFVPEVIPDSKHRRDFDAIINSQLDPDSNPKEEHGALVDYLLDEPSDSEENVEPTECGSELSSEGEWNSVASVSSASTNRVRNSSAEDETEPTSAIVALTRGVLIGNSDDRLQEELISVNSDGHLTVWKIDGELTMRKLLSQWIDKNVIAMHLFQGKTPLLFVFTSNRTITSYIYNDITEELVAKTKYKSSAHFSGFGVFEAIYVKQKQFLKNKDEEDHLWNDSGFESVFANHKSWEDLPDTREWNVAQGCNIWLSRTGANIFEVFQVREDKNMPNLAVLQATDQKGEKVLGIQYPVNHLQIIKGDIDKIGFFEPDCKRYLHNPEVRGRITSVHIAQLENFAISVTLSSSHFLSLYIFNQEMFEMSQEVEPAYFFKVNRKAQNVFVMISDDHQNYSIIVVNSDAVVDTYLLSLADLYDYVNDKDYDSDTLSAQSR